MKGKEEPVSFQLVLNQSEAPSLSTNFPVQPFCVPRKSVNWACPLTMTSTQNFKKFPIKRSSARLGSKALARTNPCSGSVRPKKNLERSINQSVESSEEKKANRVIAYSRTKSSGGKSEASAARPTEPQKESNCKMQKRARIFEGGEKQPDVRRSIGGQGKEWVSVPLGSMEGQKSTNAERTTSEADKSTKPLNSEAKMTDVECHNAFGSIDVTCEEKAEVFDKKSGMETHDTADKEFCEALARSKRVVHDLEQIICKRRDSKLQKLRMEKAQNEAIVALEQERLRNEITQLSQKNFRVLEEKLAIERERDLLQNDFSGKLEKELDSYRSKIDRGHAEIVSTLTIELGREQEKSRCQICFTSPRDAIVLPCLHFQYCNECLRQHQRRVKECPTCRAKINGVIRCNLFTD